MLHQTAQERYEKLKRVFRRLMRNFNRDDLDDFVLTANSLSEWIQHDRSVTREQRKAFNQFAVPVGIDWQICHQVANRQKHVLPKPVSQAKTNPNAPVVKAVRVVSGGKGFVLPPSTQAIGAGEDITVEFESGTESGLAFVIRTFRHFHYTFEITPLPLGDRASAGAMTAAFFGF